METISFWSVPQKGKCRWKEKCCSNFVERISDVYQIYFFNLEQLDFGILMMNRGHN